MQVTQERNGWAQVPHWLLKAVKPAAVVVYAQLTAYAWMPDGARPAIRRVADELGMSESTVKRCIQELEDAGAVVVEARQQDGVQLPNRYHLNLTRGGGGFTGEPTGGSMSEPRVGSPVTYEAEEVIEEEVSKTSTAVAVRDPNAGQLVGEWIDSCTHRPPSRVIGQVSKEVKALVTDKVPIDVIRRTIVAWQERGLHPSTLASVAHELMNASPTRGRMGKQAQQQAETDALFDRAMQRARARDAADEMVKDGTSPQLPMKGIW